GILHELCRRGVRIIVFSPLRGRALERSADQQNGMGRPTRRSTPSASTYYQVRAGGDSRTHKAIAKEQTQRGEEQGKVLNHAIIAEAARGRSAVATDFNR
ncbi:CbbBc protein, partial [Klebsiella pneumoniae]